MKKVLLLAFMATAVAFVSNAQISKGSVLLGGNLNFNSSKTEDANNESKQKSIGFAPTVGLAVRTNTILGILVGYSRNSFDYPPGNFYPEEENTSISSEVFLRKYFPLGKDFYFFGQGGVFVNSSKGENKASQYKQESKNLGVGLSLQPGVSYAVSKKFHLEAGLNNMANIGFHKSETKTIPGAGQTTTSKGQGFNFSSSLNSGNYFNIGFRFFL